jgi:dTDP-4-amino-4,6-dideoxygalactose transaminase
MINTNFSPWPSFTQEEADKIQEVLLSNKVNYWTGQEGREFEKEFARYTDSQYAVAVANGTLALDLALKGLDIGKGNEVIVTSRTFLASVSSIITAGANPVFADVDLESQNITVDTIKDVLSSKTKAIICVHLAGWPCDMDSINELAEQHNLYVIEDCAQAHGARYKGKSVGSLGDVGCWSFCQDKIMSTGGEGGMVTTNSKQLWDKMWSYKDHGKTWHSVYEKQHPPGRNFKWLHDRFGTNWRLTEMQSAIGRIQLKRMTDWHNERGLNANKLKKIVQQFDCVRIPLPLESIEHAWYKFYFFVVPEKLKTGWSRDKIVDAMWELGTPCIGGSCSEVYKERAFEGTDFIPSEPLKNAVQLGDTSLMMMVHPTLSQQEVDLMAEHLQAVLSEASA